MLTRRVTLFGRSIPLALILAALIVVGAAAAGWFVLFIGNGTLSTAAGYDAGISVVTISNQVGGAVCTGDRGLGGTDPDSFDVALGNFSPGAACQVNLTIITLATNPGPIYVPPAVLSGTAASQLMASTPSCGAVLAPDTTTPVALVLSADPSILPDQVLVDFQIDMDFPATPPTCP